MDTLPAANYPLPTLSALQLQYVGKHLDEVFTPAAVIDRAIVKRNCDAMLHVCKSLSVGFRAHIKSHKTLELSKVQVGDDGPADFVVSTLIEAENLLPFLLESQERGRCCSVLYGVPIPQSAVPRLLNLTKRLPPYTFNVLVDNQDAFDQYLKQAQDAKIGIYVKIDTGYERAGIKITSPKFESFVKHIVDQAPEHLKGFYSHYGHSYHGSSEDDAAHGLIEELKGLENATKAVPSSFTNPLILTVGATPTATAAQNILSSTGPKSKEAKSLLESLGKKFKIELHAGVYPLLDMQQVATGARPAAGTGLVSETGFQPLNKENIGMKILVEVTSTYDERSKPEALISAGSLALGREPCKSYPGWGVVSPSLSHQGKGSVYDERGDKTGWIVGRVSQEHGILSWEGDRGKMQPLAIGDRLLIWPNHACVAGAGFGWYLVVDEGVDGGQRIVDVWVRWRGW